MLGKRIVRSPYLLPKVVVTVGIGCLLGIASVSLPPFLVIGAVIAGGALFIVLKRPELGLLSILVLTSSIIFYSALPILPIGIGSLHIPDILLLTLLGQIVLRLVLKPKFRLVRTSLDWPLIIFIGWALLSTFFGVLRSTVGIVDARQAFRDVSYYLTFFVVTNSLQEMRQIRYLLKGMFFIATVVAVAIIAQFVLGESVQFMPGVGSLDSSSVAAADTARVLPPGRSMILVFFITLTVLLVMEKLRLKSWTNFVQWILIGAALMMTFLRSYWLVTGLAFLLLVFLTKGEIRRRLIGWGLAATSLLLLVLVFSALASSNSEISKLLSGSSERFSTLLSPNVLQESSLQWRFIENQYAVSSIISNPIFGVGVGGKYRPFDRRLDHQGMTWDARSFIHNGHLWILETMGFPGYVFFMSFLAIFLVRSFRNWRSIPDSQMRGFVLGFTLAMLGMLITATVESAFGTWIWTPIIGTIMGVNEFAFRYYSGLEYANELS